MEYYHRYYVRRFLHHAGSIQALSPSWTSSSCSLSSLSQMTAQMPRARAEWHLRLNSQVISMPLPVSWLRVVVVHEIVDWTNILVITIISAALASYNALELILLIFSTFKTYNGLYFISMLSATCAIIPYVIGMVTMYFDPSAKIPGLIVNNIGWIVMVVAQSVVLYSRLGIVLGKRNSRILIFTKWMIIIDGIIFYTLATVIVFGMHFSNNSNFAASYVYSERLQMTGRTSVRGMAKLRLLKVARILYSGIHHFWPIYLEDTWHPPSRREETGPQNTLAAFRDQRPYCRVGCRITCAGISKPLHNPDLLQSISVLNQA